MIDFGETFSSPNYEVRDAAGILVNAGTVTATITLPDDTATNPTVNNPSAGIYNFDYLTSQFGRHQVMISATGGVLGSLVRRWVDTFDVRPAVPVLLVSLESMKTQLNIPETDTTHDEELREYIEAASGVAELISGATVHASVTETHHGGKPGLVLRRYPVMSITSVTENGAAVASTGYGLSDAGVLYRRAGFQAMNWLRGVNNVVVVYVAGRPVVAGAVSLGVKLIAQHLWDTRRGASQITGLGGDDGVAVEMETVRMYGYSIPNRARELLATVPKAPGFG